MAAWPPPGLRVRRGGRPTVMDPDKLAAARARRARGESPTQIANGSSKDKDETRRELILI